MMDRNREARRAVSMANGLHRRRLHHHQHPRTSSTNIPEEDGGLELQEAARLRDRTAKERDREIRDRDRERLSRSKRRKSDESSDESVNDDEDYDDGTGGGSGGVTTSNQVHVSSPPAAVTLTSQRKSYPPPSKVYRVTPTWKAPDEMIGVSIPRKARSASAKRSQEHWNSGGLLESSSSPMRSDMMAASTTARVPSPSSAPLSPSSSNVSMKKKIKPNGVKHRPPKPTSTSKSSPSIQDEIEIEVAEVLYGLRQTQAPTPAPAPASSSKPETMSNDSPATNFTAPKRKRPRLHPEEVNRKPDPNQLPKLEENGGLSKPNDVVKSSLEPTQVPKNGVVSDKMTEESVRRGENEMVWCATKVEEVSSSSPKLESSHNLDRVKSSSTFIKPNSTPVEQENRRGDKFEIDLMAPASPEKEEEEGKYGGREVRDEKSMVTDRDRETDSKSKQNEVEDFKSVKMDSGSGGGCAELNRGPLGGNGDESKATAKSEPHTVHHKTKMLSSSSPLHQQEIKPNGKERNLSLQLDLEKTGVNNDRQKQQFPKNSIKDDCNLNSKAAGGQPSSVPFPMSVPAGWHGGLAPMGYVGPLQGVVSMDGTTMPSPPIQPTPPHFLLSQPRPKRCATHCHIARSISVHQQMMKMSPFWPPVAAAPLFGAKPSNMTLVPQAELHSGRAGVMSLAQDSKAQPLAFFPGQPSPVVTKDKNCQATSVSESIQNKQLLLQPGIPPGAATNMMHAPALFFPMGQQQAAASTRPGSGKSPSTASGAASTSTLTSAPMGAAVSNASPAMSFSYPNMNGNEAQFMAILGNGSYPFPIPAHVGAPPPYRGSHPQAMPFFNGSFYPSQMLHPSQLQQNHQNPTMSTTPSSSSHKQVQNQQQRPQGNNPNLGNLNQNSSMQNLQTTKSRDIGGDDTPSTTADSRNRPNMSVYGQNFVMPFHSPNFALMPSSLGGGNHGDKKHHHQQSQQAAPLNSPFPMSFATINGATSPGLDISSMSMPEAAKYSYQMMAAAAQATAQQGKTEHRGPENSKPLAADPSTLDDERRGMASRASVSSVGQSIAFSRDNAENTIVESSAKSHKQQQQQQQQQQGQQQQQQPQLLFSKQQQYTPPTSSNAHSKTPSTSSRNVYPDNLTSPGIMGAKFPSNLSGFPIGGPTQSQWKNSVRPITSQMSSPSITTTTSSPSNGKNLSQQQGMSQSQTHISFGASQGQQTHSSSHAPAGSPSNSSVSKSNGGSPRTSASNKALGQQGKNSPSQSQSTQKPSILGSPHMVSSQGSAGKPQSQQPHQQPQLSKQSIQQAQLYFNNYMQANTSAAMVGTGYYLQQQQQLQQHMQQQQLQQHMQQQLQGSKSKGSAPPISSTTCSPVTMSDPAKAGGGAGQLNGAASNSKGGLHSLSMYHTAQSSGGAHQLTPASFQYMNAASPVVPVKSADQKQPAGD